MTDRYFYKLTEEELRALVTSDEAETILAASRARKPGTHAENVVRVYLNKAKSIWVQSIHFYGGENFGEPYHFMAEITHTTTGSHFTQFCNKNRQRLQVRSVVATSDVKKIETATSFGLRIPFTY